VWKVLGCERFCADALEMIIRHNAQTKTLLGTNLIGFSFWARQS
jgi:hypothetical protein